MRGLCWSEVTDWKLTSVWAFHHCETKISSGLTPPPSTQTAGSLSALFERREKLAVPMTRWTEKCKDLLPRRLSLTRLEWPNPETFETRLQGERYYVSVRGTTFAISHLGATAAATAAFWTTFVHDLNLLRQYCEQWSRICCIFQGVSRSHHWLFATVSTSLHFSQSGRL